MLKLFQLIEKYVLGIWVYSTVLKNETATMFFS